MKCAITPQRLNQELKGAPSNDDHLLELLYDPNARYSHFLPLGGDNDEGRALAYNRKTRSAERFYAQMIESLVKRLVRHEASHDVQTYLLSFGLLALHRSVTLRALYRAQDLGGIYRFTRAALKNLALNARRGQRARREAEHASIEELCTRFDELNIPQPSSPQEALGLPPDPASLPSWAQSDARLQQSDLPCELVEYLLGRSVFVRVVALARIGYEQLSSKDIVEIMDGVHSANAVDQAWHATREHFRRARR